MLIYLHVPKCAGSTMMIYLKRYYRIHQVKSWWREDWENISPRAQCIFGHFPFGIVERKLLGRHQRITFLRDPVERVISLYFHITWKFSHPEHEYFSKHTLAEVIESGKYAAFDNDMVRFIGGMPQVAFQKPETKVNGECLERAEINLMRFDAIGFIETFKSDLARMARMFGWDDIAYNKTTTGRRPKREDLHPDTVKLIEKNTLLDMELYHHAKSVE